MNVKLCSKYLISIYGAVRVLGPGVSSYKGYLLWVSGGPAVNPTQVPALLLISLSQPRSLVFTHSSSFFTLSSNETLDVWDLWRCHSCCPLTGPVDTPGTGTPVTCHKKYFLVAKIFLVEKIFFSHKNISETLEIFWPQAAGLERLGHGSGEHVPVCDGGEPEGELVGEVVAGAARPVTLDEGRGAEVLQTRARARQGLAPALGTRGRVLRKYSVSRAWNKGIRRLPKISQSRRRPLQGNAYTRAFTFKTLLRHYAKRTLTHPFYDNCVVDPISRLLTMGSRPI